jgi:hypothetical protein
LHPGSPPLGAPLALVNIYPAVLVLKCRMETDARKIYNFLGNIFVKCKIRKVTTTRYIAICFVIFPFVADKKRTVPKYMRNLIRI